MERISTSDPIDCAPREQRAGMLAAAAHGVHVARAELCRRAGAHGLLTPLRHVTDWRPVAARAYVAELLDRRAADQARPTAPPDDVAGSAQRILEYALESRRRLAASSLSDLGAASARGRDLVPI